MTKRNWLALGVGMVVVYLGILFVFMEDDEPPVFPVAKMPAAEMERRGIQPITPPDAEPVPELVTPVNLDAMFGKKRSQLPEQTIDGIVFDPEFGESGNPDRCTSVTLYQKDLADRQDEVIAWLDKGTPKPFIFERLGQAAIRVLSKRQGIKESVELAREMLAEKKAAARLAREIAKEKREDERIAETLKRGKYGMLFDKKRQAKARRDYAREFEREVGRTTDTKVSVDGTVLVIKSRTHCSAKTIADLVGGGATLGRYILMGFTAVTCDDGDTVWRQSL